MTIPIHDNAVVFTADVKKVGVVKRVVIDPLTKQATHLVVKKGVLFPEDRVIPVAAIADASEYQINLDPECDLAQFPPFESPSEPEGMPFNRYGLYGLPFPATPPATTPVPKERNIPERSVPLETHAEVIVGGEKIGSFEELLTEVTGVTTHLIVVLGTFDPVRKAIPIGWVKSFEEDTIRLGVPLGTVERLAEYHPEEMTA